MARGQRSNLIAACVLSASIFSCRPSKKPDLAPINTCDKTKDPTCGPRPIQTNTASATSGGTLESAAGGVSLIDVCTLAKSNSAAAPLSSVIDFACGSTSVVTSVKSGYLFMGSGVPSIKEDGVQELSAEKRTSVKYSSGLKIAGTNAKSYYNLVRLQVSKPSDFQSQGFESDSAHITYTVQASSIPNTVKYDYKNNAKQNDGVIVEYVADATFIELAKDKAYLVTTILTESKDTVISLKGLDLIVEAPDGVEVYSFSDQTFDNKGNHQSTLSNSRDSLKTEIERSYRNGKNASKANSFFP